MRNKFVAGNWKLNTSRQSARDLASAVVAGTKDCATEIAVCPPFVHLAEVAQVLEGSNVDLGAQNVSEQTEGAYTGEISAAMLVDYACRYVVLGHSERRHVYGETDTLIAEKYLQTVAAGLTPIFCVGETLQERESEQTEAVVSRQLAAVMEAQGSDGFASAIIAYEPVWAIGTGKTATPDQAQTVHAFIRGQLNVDVVQQTRILYGGSVKPGNAAELFAMPDIDGGLIGGAALVADDFLAICRAAT